MNPTSKEILEAAKKLNIHPDTIRRRIRNGMPAEEALTKPAPSLRARSGFRWDKFFPAHHKRLRENGG